MFEIGSSLRAARERQGLGYPEIELATKIRSRYIRALEAEDFTALPGDAYIRGFLKTYADYLGLDGEVYVEEYGSRFITSWRDEIPPPRRDRSRSRRRERGFERRSVLLAVTTIAVLTGLVFVAFRFGGSSTPVPGLETTKQTTQTAAGRLVLRGLGSGSYVVVRHGGAGGEVALQGTVGHGEIERLQGSSFYLLVRRPAGLHVTFGGKAVSLPAVRNLRLLVTARQTKRLRG